MINFSSLEVKNEENMLNSCLTILGIFRNNFGVVRYSSHLLNLDILNQNRIFEDGYNDYYSYDDCILDEVSKNYLIKDILKSEEKKMISKGMDESMFGNVSNLLENLKNFGYCKDPNLKLQTTFIQVTSLDIFNTAWIGPRFLPTFSFNLEFPSFIMVKEVNLSYTKIVQ